MIHRDTLLSIAKNVILDKNKVVYQGKTCTLMCEITPNGQILVLKHVNGKTVQMVRYKQNEFVTAITELVESNPFDWSVRLGEFVENRVINLDERR